MIVSSDLLGAVILGGVFATVLLISELWAHWGNPKPEWTRKTIHLGGGMVCLFFPFFIRSYWVVLGMSVLLSAAFALGAKLNLLKSLHGVERRSRGSEYYPLAIFLVFVMTVGEPWLYVSAVLVLAVADAFAALIGTTYGQIRYEVESSSKSLEGSLVFMIIAFLAIHLPCLLMTDLPRETCVLAALLVAILVTGFEAISLGGLDNLFVPIGVVAILARITTKPVPEIVFQLSSLGIFCTIVISLIRQVKAFNAGGTILFILFTYGAWSLGAPVWTLPVMVAFLLYIAAWGLVPPGPETIIKVRVRIMFRALVVPIILLVIANSFRLETLLFAPYVAAWSLVAALTLDNHLRMHSGWKSRTGTALASALTASIPISGVTWTVMRATPFCLPLVIVITTSALTLLHAAFARERKITNSDQLWTALQMFFVFLAAITVLLIQILPHVGCWTPLELY